MVERTYRCAVYTRKSTEDGLEQEFNSLDAHDEACTAYALSQRHEGWVLSRRRHRQPSLLTGKLFDGDGHAMTPSHASRPNKRYRYYITRPDQVDGAPAWRVPAHDLEQLVCRCVAERLGERGIILDLSGDATLMPHSCSS